MLNCEEILGSCPLPPLHVAYTAGCLVRAKYNPGASYPILIIYSLELKKMKIILSCAETLRSGSITITTTARGVLAWVLGASEVRCVPPCANMSSSSDVEERTIVL